MLHQAFYFKDSKETNFESREIAIYVFELIQCFLIQPTVVYEVKK